MMVLRKRWVVPAAAFILIGCSSDDKDPVAPTPVEPDLSEVVRGYLSCTAELGTANTISCAPTDPPATESETDVEGDFIRVEAHNVGYDAGTETLSADIALHNSLLQALGSADGITPDPSGVRVFFVNEPVTTGGTGDVTVSNADGTASFNGNDQSYFQYSQIIAPSVSSVAKSWEWNAPATVESFTFEIGVSALVSNATSLTPGLAFIPNLISTDSLATCVVGASGQPWCWGRGRYGALGNREVLDEHYPVEVKAGGRTYVSVSTGQHHSCGLTTTGEAFCWGYGSNGRLGHGATTSSNVPFKVLGGIEFVQVSNGRSHSCGLDTEGRAWCWGGGANSKLGNGSANDVHIPEEVQGGHRYTYLSAGRFHTCAISVDGDSYCWGSGSNGKLGTGNTSTQSTPAKVSGGHAFTKIFAGQQQTCALTADGTAYCWGSNASRQLGDGTSSSRNTPVLVNTDKRFVTMSVGWNNTCGVTAGGDAYCWGSNGLGKLGNMVEIGELVDTPTKVEGIDERVIDIATGSSQTCALTDLGNVYCMGTNTQGALGLGDEEDTITTPTLTLSLAPVVTEPDN